MLRKSFRPRKSRSKTQYCSLAFLSCRAFCRSWKRDRPRASSSTSSQSAPRRRGIGQSPERHCETTAAPSPAHLGYDPEAVPLGFVYPLLTVERLIDKRRQHRPIFFLHRHRPVTAITASLILATAKFPSFSNSRCGRLGISSAGTTQSTIAGPSAWNASLISACNSPGFVALNP